jgi:far upstream element-binding protein
VNLIGPPQAAQLAKDLIMEIVDSDTKNLANPSQRDGGRGGGQNFGYDGRHGGENEKINDTLTVPSGAVGMIIGKGIYGSFCTALPMLMISIGGETIKDMQNKTGCKINVSQPQGRDIERQIGLVGTRHAIEQAKRAIMEKVDAVVSPRQFATHVCNMLTFTIGTKESSKRSTT